MIPSASSSLPDATATAAGARHFSPGRFALLLALLVIASWPDVIAGVASFVLRDYSVFGYPLAHHLRECFWRGELPLWNPLNNCGLPFLAQWNTMVLYPGSLLYLLLPLPWSLSVFCLLHLWVGGLGAYIIARRWTGLNFAAAVAGVAYAFHGLMQQSLMWPNNIAALGLLPWVILSVETGVREGGRKFVVAALVGALQMLTGAPEVIVFTWLLAGVLCEGNRQKENGKSEMNSAGGPGTFAFRLLPSAWSRACRFTTLIALTAALSSAQLLPFLDLLRHSQREAGFGDSVWSLPAWGVANFLVPLFNTILTSPGVPLHSGQNWTSSYYAGAGVFALAWLAVLRVSDGRARRLSLLAFFCVLLALGPDGLIYSALDRVLPLGLMRYPVKFLIPLTFILPLLAAFAIKELFRDCEARSRGQAEGEPDVSPSPAATARPETHHPQLETPTADATVDELRARMARHRLRAITAVLLAATALIAIVGWFNPVPGEEDTGLVFLLFSATASGLFLVFLVAAMLRARLAPRAAGQMLWSVAVLGLLVADLRLHLPNLTPRIPPAYFQPGQPDLQALTPAPRDGTARASLTWHALKEFKTTMLPSLADTLLLQRIGLYDNLNLLDGLAKTDGIFSLYLREQQEIEARLFLAGGTNSLPAPLADFLGVAHVSSPTNIFKWQRRATARPLVTAGQNPEFSDYASILNALATTNWNPATTVFLSSGDRSRVPATNGVPAKILSANWAAHRLECEVESSAPTLVVIAQAFYHPWRATVNGQPTEILRANHAFQAVPIPAGRSTVRLEYVDRCFQLGVTLSVLAFILCAGLWWRARPIRVGDDGRNLTSTRADGGDS